MLYLPAACALRLGADSLLPALVRSLDAMKQPAARVSVMEFCVLFLGPGKVAGVPNTTGPLRCVNSKRINPDRASVLLLPQPSSMHCHSQLAFLPRIMSNMKLVCCMALQAMGQQEYTPAAG